MSPDISGLAAAEVRARCAVCALVQEIQDLAPGAAARAMERFTPPAVDQPSGAARFTVAARPARDQPGYVHAEAGGVPVGCLQWRDGLSGPAVTGIFVHPGYRRLGIATALFIRARAAAGGVLGHSVMQLPDGASWVRSLNR